MLIAVGSLKSSPGATTAAAAMAAMWPGAGAGEPMLLEVDSAGGDLAARFGLAPTPGLMSLSATARREHEASSFAEHVQKLPGGLKIVLAPPAEEHASAAVALLGRDGRILLEAVAKADDVAVIADVGRLSPAGPGWPVVAAADVLLVVVRPVLPELTRVITAAEQLIARCAASGTRLGLVTVGAGPFPVVEIEESTGIAVLAELPDDAAAASMLAGRPDPRGRLSRIAGRGGIAGLPLAKAAARLATELAGLLTHATADVERELHPDVELIGAEA